MTKKYAFTTFLISLTLSALYYWVLAFYYLSNISGPWCTTRDYSQTCQAGDYLERITRFIPFSILVVVATALMPWILMLFVRSMMTIVLDVRKWKHIRSVRNG